MSIRYKQLALACCMSLCGVGCRQEPTVANPRAQRATIEPRLEQAKSLQKAGRESLLPMEKDLILLINFEKDDTVYLGEAGVLSVALEKTHYREGKFGRGYYFEKPHHNLLPPDVAQVGKDVDGFHALQGAELGVVDCDTPVGKKALSVAMHGKGSGIETRPMRVNYRRRSWEEYGWSLMASAYVKGRKDAKIRVEVTFVPKEVKVEPKNLPDGKKEPEAIADQSTPQEVTLAGEWERVACCAKTDCRVGEREAVFRIQSADDSAVTLLADGLQFEQVGYNPHAHEMPTTWLPGGQSSPASSVLLSSPVKEMFPVEEGSIAFWTSTPQESNLRKPGGLFWISFGSGWAPQWCLSTYRCATPQGFAWFTNTNVGDGAWHHVAMTWDRVKACLYKDGRPFGSFEYQEKELPKNLETYALRIGGSISDGQAANSIMDEVAIFKRKMGEEEIRQLAEATKPLRPTADPLLLSRSPRTVFYRDEKDAPLEIRIAPLRPIETALNVDFAVGDLVFSTQSVKTGSEGGMVRFGLDVRQLKCGMYPCRVGCVVAGQVAYVEFPIEVVPSLRTDHYLISSWGEGGETAEGRAYFKSLGLNLIDTYATDIEELGRNGFIYCWHYEFGNGVWSPSNRETVREFTRTEARFRSNFPNWKYTLLNSEVEGGLPDAENRQSWFDAWAEKELGFPMPAKRWLKGHPDSCWFSEDQQPGKDGIYKKSNEFAFLKWLCNRGCGWWRLNAEAVAEIRKLRPDVKCWTDPLRYPGQISDLDAGSTWSYQISPEPLIGIFEESYAVARGSGKEFYATLGMNYASSGHGLTDNVTEPDGVKKNLVPTADDMIQQAWLAVTRIASAGVTYWDVFGVYDGLKRQHDRYAEAGADVKLGTVLKNDLLPLGTMLKGVPNAQRSLALLIPESTRWMCSGEGKWEWGPYHYTNLWKIWIGRTGIPYDVVLDNNITPGSLAKYKVIIFPMAQFVSETVYNELVAAGKAGTRIIVDGHCRQEYPNMERWEQTYKLTISVSDPSYNATAEKPLAELVQKLVPELDAYAVGEQGPVFTSAREWNGVKYIAVVNNLRQEGPYTQWTRNPAFKPYGKAQTARVCLKAPKRSVVYEFTESKKLDVRTEGDRLVVDVALPPHAGRLLCVYPQEMKQIQFGKEDRYAAGQATTLEVRVLDAQGKNMPGRQLLQVSVVDAAGKEHDESGWYRVEDGLVRIPFRPAINDSPGEWTIKVVERTSGLKATKSPRVDAEKR